MIDNLTEKYSVGSLLYSPALNSKVADSVINDKFAKPYSLAICLEDTISADKLEESEDLAVETVRQISVSNKEFYLPKIFIRVREPDQALRLFQRVRPYLNVLTGFIFPKYALDNAVRYNESIVEINTYSNKRLYMMPILESSDLVDAYTRPSILSTLRGLLNGVKDYVLNVRVGGNDFSNVLSVRRHMNETIYDIAAISSLFGDIISIFSQDYVVSGPVWEYFSSSGSEWKDGLAAEVRKDKLNGFIGKTVIHPNQIPVVNEMLRVARDDYEDAKLLIGWDNEEGFQVGKSANGERMNEVRTHYNWARKIITLAEIYGVRDGI